LKRTVKDRNMGKKRDEVIRKRETARRGLEEKNFLKSMRNKKRQRIDKKKSKEGRTGPGAALGVLLGSGFEGITRDEKAI